MPTVRRAHRLRVSRALAILAGCTLMWSTATHNPASALPPPPPNPSGQQLDSAAAAKKAAQDAVAQAATQQQQIEEKLEVLEAQTVDAGQKHDEAVAQLEKATTHQKETQQAVTDAAAAVTKALSLAGDLGKQAYMDGNYIYSDVMLLTSEGPQDLVDKSSMLAIAAKVQQDKIDAVQIAKTQKANADSAAKQAVIDKASAEAAAQQTLIASQNQLANAQSALTVLQAQKTAADAAFATAQNTLLTLEGQKAAYDQWLAQKQAEDAAAQAAAQAKAAAQAAAAQQASAGTSQSAPSGGGPKVNGAYALPAAGRLTTCFCMRWGVMHWGIDLAAPFMTPIYAAGSGTVMRAGAATGFGQAIYIQQPDGWVTVYGHIEAIYVSAGQQVTAGTKIAGMGSRGFSTGVHLHFEVTMGMYGQRTNPIDWLAARGISI